MALHDGIILTPWNLESSEKNNTSRYFGDALPLFGYRETVDALPFPVNNPCSKVTNVTNLRKDHPVRNLAKEHRTMQ
jgi:hypothetical protein